MRDRIRLPLFAVLFYVLSYVSSHVAMSSLHISYVSQIDLSIFIMILSSLATLAIMLVFSADDEEKQNSRMPLSWKGYILLITLGVILISVLAVALTMICEGNRSVAFQEWCQMSPVLTAVSILIYVDFLYAPGYILNRTVLHTYSLNFGEKVVFYPLLGCLILGLLNVIETYCRVGILDSLLFIIVVNGLVVALFLHDYRCKKMNGRLILSENWFEMLGVVLAVVFVMFLFWSAVNSDIFLRGDMWSDAHRVAFLNKYGISSYFESPVEGYPPFFSLFWSGVSKLLPIPYVNTLIIVAFFNQAFGVMTFYYLAKTLFRSKKYGLLSVISWTVFSGFSFTYLLSHSPSTPIAGADLLNYLLYQVAGRYGVCSGSIVSSTCTDGEAVTRLWSLAFYFVAITALLKAHSSNRPRIYLCLFSLSLLQILLGHVTEVPFVAVALLASILLKPRPHIYKGLVLSSFLPGLAFLVLSLGVFNPMLAVAALTPGFASVSGIFLVQLWKRVGRLLSKNFDYVKRILTKVSIYLYGLMLLAFALNYSRVWINWAISTVWYSLAVEWGFIGLIAVLALLVFEIGGVRFNFGLKFSLCLLFLQLLILVALNFYNYYFSYLATPYPFEPILFFPVLALISSQAFTSFNSRARKHRRLVKAAIAILVLGFFVFGSFDHVLSASYWKANDGWWLNAPLNPSKDDFELMNFLYSAESSNTSYQFVGTLNDFYSPQTYVIYPSGLTALSSPLIDILWTAQDSREVYLLTRTFPIDYALISNLTGSSIAGNQSYVLNAVKTFDPTFTNDKYKLYKVSTLNLTSTTLPESTAFITTEKIVFDGKISMVSEVNETVQLNPCKGTILPLQNGYVSVDITSREKGSTNFTVFAPDIRLEGNTTLVTMKSSWDYFGQIDCVADKLDLSGQVSFDIFNTFTNRIYLEHLAHSGQYTAKPLPGHLRPDYAKQQIQTYQTVNSINPLVVVVSPIGIVWFTLLFGTCVLKKS